MAAVTSITNGLQGSDELNDLRRRVASLEDRWADVHNSKGSSGELSGPAVAQLTTYLTQGNQYRVANPGPLGLYAFGYTTALLQGYNTKWTEQGTNLWVYSFALFFGGLVQLLAGMWELWRNNVFGGTAFSCYGGFWLGYGIFGILESAQIFAAPTAYAHGTQMMLIIWGCLTFFFFLATLVINAALMTLFSSLVVTFFLLAAGETGHPKLTKAGGYFGVWTAGVAWYIATAELLNSVYRRTILPLGVVNVKLREPSKTGIDRPDTL